MSSSSRRTGRSGIQIGHRIGQLWQVADALEAAHGRGIVHRDLGRNPAWSADGRELFFKEQATMLGARIVSWEPVLRTDAPRVVFEGGFETSNQRPFDVAPDGRFLVIERRDETPAEAIILVRNWLAASGRG